VEDHRPISHSAAAARLRLAGDVRKRARRALMLPPFALLVLAIVIAGRGVLMEAWPHPGVPWLAWIGVFVLVRVALGGRWRSRGVQASGRVRALRAGAGLLAVAIAIVTGADALILGAGAAVAAAAFLGGLPALGLAALLAAGVSEGLVLEGARPGVGLIVFGAGLGAIAVSRYAIGESAS
jgi:hypothetical protein